MADTKPPLHMQVAERIKADLNTFPGNHLPPLRVLRVQYGVSLNTVSKAVYLLRDEGLLEVSQGKAVAIRKPAESTEGSTGRPQGWESSSSTLYRDIRQAIESGTYRTGEPLPKLKYFVLTKKVTENTVCAAFSMLREQNLVHKRGKRWLVGPSSASRVGVGGPMASGPSSPIILIVVPDYESWRLFFVEHLRAFMSEFFAGLRHHGVQFVLVQAEEMGSSLARHHPTGRNEIVKAIGEFGNRYQGAFVHSEYRVFPEIQDWISWLLKFGKPVVWLDYDDSAPKVDRRAISSERYFRLYANIGNCVETALRVLRDHGHSRIGVPHHGFHVNEGWTMRRIETIRRIAEERFPSMKIDVQRGEESFWNDYRELVRDNVFDETILLHANAIDVGLKKSSPEMSVNRRRRKLRAGLLASVSTLTSLINDGCTAILALNQFMAINAFYWLKYVDVEVPGDMSLMAFDNIPPMVNHPISTMDFGFANLGYRAAHLFIGDIPVRTDKWGNIGSKPSFLNRGSLGPPRKHTIRLTP